MQATREQLERARERAGWVAETFTRDARGACGEVVLAVFKQIEVLVHTRSQLRVEDLERLRDKMIDLMLRPRSEAVMERDAARLRGER